jgi:hypothetical protein
MWMTRPSPALAWVQRRSSRSSSSSRPSSGATPCSWRASKRLAARARAEHPPHVDRPAKALEGLGAEIAAVEQARNEAKGLRRNEDRVGFRERLQAGGEIGRLADRRLFLGSPREIADNGDARGDADADLQRNAWQRPQDRHGGDDGKAGAHGALGIVFVRCRIAEIDEHAIPHVLGDVAPEAGDLAGAAALKGRKDLPVLLRIEVAGERGRADHVAEQDRELAPLGGRWISRLASSAGRDVDRRRK